MKTKTRTLSKKDIDTINKSKSIRYSSYTIAGMVMAGMPDEISDKSLLIKDKNHEIVIACFSKSPSALELERKEKITTLI